MHTQRCRSSAGAAWMQECAWLTRAQQSLLGACGRSPAGHKAGAGRAVRRACTWAGELVTVTPADSSARILSCAVPLPPAQRVQRAGSPVSAACPAARREQRGAGAAAAERTLAAASGRRRHGTATSHRAKSKRQHPPEMMAPAWPMRRPGGAVRPAMKETTGLLVPLSLMNCAASSSAEPPISPAEAQAKAQAAPRT